jgi:CubicO group peptidase (beta-lactamase class C family)
LSLLTEQIDAIFAPWDRSDSPGCAMAVMRQGEIIYSRGYGMANLEYDIPITPTTVFHVASVSKQFTALAVLLLAQEGKLALDDKVRDYVPELHEFDHPITIRQLIHHTSGLRDQWELLLLAGWRMDDVITTEDILNLVWRQRDLNFQPGAEYLYCNTGYTLMALLVERISGVGFPTFCTERIFQPLGMQDTHFHDDHTVLVKGRAYSYRPQEDGTFRHTVLSYATAGATSLFTTARDLALWDRNFYTGKVGGQATLQQMSSQGILNDGRPLTYAFGLQVKPYRGQPVMEHSGGDAGYRAHLIRLPQQNLSITILGNLSTLTPGLLVRRVADLYLDQEPDAIPNDTAQSLDEEIALSLSEAQLRDKAGLYYNADQATLLRIEFDSDRLKATLGFNSDLLPQTEHEFQLVSSPQILFRFVTTSEGSWQLHELADQAKPPVVYEALPLLALAIETLAGYTGAYHSEELDATYTLSPQGETLVLRPRRHAATNLQPLFRDGFMNTFGHVLLFQRDSQGALAGFTLSTGRVRHIQFRRDENL